MHIHKARPKHEEEQLYLITHFTIHTEAYLLLTLNATARLLKFSKQKGLFFCRLNLVRFQPNLPRSRF